MGLDEQIRSAVADIVNSDWSVRSGSVVPKTEDVVLRNGAVELDAVYLYADLANSTTLARDFDRRTAAKVIRAFLSATCRVIRARDGKIRSFDGDRVMAIFVGERKNSDAAKAGLQVNYVVEQIVRPAIEKRFPAITRNDFEVRHCVGIASGTALVVRGGVRDSSDLVSIGRAPNVAAKLSDVRDPYRTYITSGVFSRLDEDSKYRDTPDERELMWQGPIGMEIGGQRESVYRSAWWWMP